MDTNKVNLTLSNDIFDRREDVYAYEEFGKFTSRFFISEQIISSKFWDLLKNKYKVKSDDIMVHCDVQRDIKGREERNYMYVVKKNKPYKIMFIFYDEKKVIDPDLYETPEEQEDKIYELFIYFQYDAIKFIEDELLPEINSLVYTPPKDKSFFVISRGSYGYELRNATVKDMDINLEMNYGKDFIKKDKEIITKLSKGKKGLFLFHGAPGTGKTTYIRKIIHDLSEDKTIIYIPSYMMHSIAEPELISFVSKFKNSILLLEDSETILTNVMEERDQAVTNILNMSDGLLNDYLDMQIIATLNVDRKIIDEALLRKGRMMVNYKFKKLSGEEATKLSKYIGSNKTYTSPQTLAEVYEDKNGKQLIDLADIDDSTKGMGFKMKRK